MSINERIKHIRKSNNLSQILFSEELNVKQATLSQVENGIIMPSLDIIKSIIGKFNISYEWLIDGEGPMLKKNVTGINGHLSGNNINGNVGNIHINSSDLSSLSEKGKVIYHEYQLLLKEIEGLKRENELLKEMVDMLKGKRKNR